MIPCFIYVLAHASNAISFSHVARPGMHAVRGCMRVVRFNF